MGFLIVGVLLLVLYLADISPVTNWHWGWIALPFALAAVWWAIVDATGMTQRRAVRKMDARKAARRQRDMEALGLNVHREKRVRVMRDASRRANTPPPPPPPPKEKSASPPPPDPPRRDPRP